MLVSTAMSAQDKLFTLEDLNFGGTNYANLRPQNMWLTWWGEQLIQTDVEECFTIDAKTGKKSSLFTLDDINKWAGSDDEKYVRHLMNATFPYPDKPIVAVGNRKAFILIDFKETSRKRRSSGRTVSPDSRPTTGTPHHEPLPTWRITNFLWLTVRARSTSYPPMAVGRSCMDRPCIVMSSASTRVPSGVLMAANWLSTVWTRAW